MRAPTRHALVSAALLAIFASACADSNATPDSAGPTAPDGSAPLAAVVTVDQQLADRYIVVFRDDVGNARDATDQATRGTGAVVYHRYGTALKGFAARLSPQAVQALQRNPNVAYIEADAVVTASATQANATWGLDRIDQRALPLDDTYTYTTTGSGVTSYIIDTGIRGSHVEFTGRLVAGFTAINDGNGTGDCNGHGTHVAGTVGGTVYGVAKQTRLVPVRVLDCGGSGTTSGVIAGVDWVAGNTARPAVANMSLGGGASTALDDAVANAVSAGVTFVVAAGNSGRDACNYSPARTPSAITVGATTNSDSRASYSNFGSCVDLFAPGSSITSAWSTGDNVAATISGTSMASPHVAGVAALYLQGNPSASPAAVTDAIASSATPGVVASAGRNSPNLLLFSGLTAPVGGGDGGGDGGPTKPGKGRK